MGNQQKQAVGPGAVLIFISTLGFSVYPILGKFVFAGGAALATVLFVRFILAALFFGTIALIREGFPHLPGKTWLTMWCMGGIGYSLMAGFYLSSVRYIPASLAALLLYAYPIIVTVLAVLSRQEELSGLKLVGLLLSTLGLILVLGLALKGINPLGIALALGAAFLYAVYILLGNHVLRTTTPLVSTSMISISAAVTYGIVGLATGGTTWTLSWGTWMGIGGIALFSTIIAMLTFFQGMKLIGATSASIISTLEPVMTVVLAVFLFSEHLSLLQMAGGVLVILGGIVAVLAPSFPPNRKGKAERVEIQTTGKNFVP
ncbi:DMT family transporter [Desulfosporosinus sp. PR]|uniref:EamA family transporter n=1 Tax=Candidatus Desulfosporosinus nitrosoreducens TaxID=3401928 RepID=UPI0027FDA9E0|nr:DMT family transporter [Desulfosporosinus sp. PR]MDQ7093473.1 DMT family transporter [Desulfosporosinus sp. PR]